MSPQKTPQRSVNHTPLDFKQVLSQKLLELKAESPHKGSQNNLDEHHLEENGEGLSQIIDFDEIGNLPIDQHTENQELLSYLDASDDSDLAQRRKEKFRVFCRKYGIDTLLNL